MGIKKILGNVKHRAENYYENKRQTWLSRGFGYFYPEPTRRVVVLRKLLELYKQDPMAQRALEQRSKDLFSSGFKVSGLTKPKTNQVNDFIKDKDVRLAWKMSRTAEDAFRYGNGFLEVDYLNDQNVDHPEKPPEEAIGIAALHSVSPRQIIIIEQDDPNSVMYGQIVSYLSMPPLAFGRTFVPYISLPLSRAIKQYGVKAKFIHPDRILHMKFHSIEDSNVGISLLEPAYNILEQKIKADRVIGTSLVRHAKPILEAILTDARTKEIKDAGKVLYNINKDPEKVAHFAHDKNLEFKIPAQSQAVLDPTKHYNIMIDQLCVMFGVPRRLLMGTEGGTISGSELNLISYFKRLESDQQTVIKPLMMKLLNQWHRTTIGGDLPDGVDIEFERTYADEIAAVKSSMLGLQNLAVAFDKGLVPKIGSRKKACDILNIEYEEDEDAYEKSKGDGFPSNAPAARPEGTQPIAKTPKEEGDQ